MTIQSYFFDSLNGDRSYSAKDFAKAFGIILSDGCIPLDAAGTNYGFDLGGTPAKTIGVGKAVVQGRFIEVTATEALTIPTGSYSGMVVIRIDSADVRAAVLAVKTNRTLTQTENLYEFPLWDVIVTNGVISSKTDRRKQGGAVAKIPPIPQLPNNIVLWAADPNGISINMGKFAGTGKPVVLFLTTAQPAPSATEHRVWIQIDNI